MMIKAALPALALTFAASLASGQVRPNRARFTLTYPDLQRVLDDAAPGDTVNAWETSYDPNRMYRIATPMTLVGGFFQTSPALVLQGPGHGTVELVGVVALGGYNYRSEPAVIADGFDHVVLDGCYLYAGGGSSDFPIGSPAFEAHGLARVTVTGSWIYASASGNWPVDVCRSDDGFLDSPPALVTDGRADVLDGSLLQGSDNWTYPHWYCSNPWPAPDCGFGVGGAGVRAQSLIFDRSVTLQGGAGAVWSNIPTCPGLDGAPYEAEQVLLIR